MPEFQIHTVESAPQGSQALLRGLHEQVGFVPNLAASMAESPALLQAFLGLRAAAAGALDPAAREAVAIAVATETGCSYCVAAHSTFALKSGAPRAAVESLRNGAAPEDARLGALARFARAVVRREHDLDARVQELLKAGLTRAQLLETLVAVAVPMLASSVFALTSARLDAAFQPQAWSRPA